jgi:hypothetical protein
MRCPHCDSRRVQSYPSVFNQNLRVGRFLTTNALGLKCAPPRRRSLVPWFTAYLVVAAHGLVALVLYHAIHDARPVPAVVTATKLFWKAFPWSLTPAVFVLAGIVRAIAAVRWNRSVFPERHAAWLRRWLCHDCGATLPGPAASE